MRVTVEVEIPDDEYAKLGRGVSTQWIADTNACSSLAWRIQDTFDDGNKAWRVMSVKPSNPGVRPEAWVPIALGETYRVMPEDRLIVVKYYTVTTGADGSVIGYTICVDDGPSLKFTPQDYGTRIVPVLQDATK